LAFFFARALRLRDFFAMNLPLSDVEVSRCVVVSKGGIRAVGEFGSIGSLSAGPLDSASHDAPNDYTQ